MKVPLTFSVGVATMNRPDRLALCLDAILEGTTLPSEIIVVDQGDGDGAREVVRRLSSPRLPIVYVPQTRRGLAASRNAAALRSRSDIIAVTDDDCVPDIDWITAVSRAFATAPYPDAVTGRVLALGPPRAGTYAISLRTSTEPADFVAATMPWQVGTGANFAVRRARLLGAGGYDERLGAGSAGLAAEDLELCHRLLRSGGRIRYEPSAVVYHERQSEARRFATRWSYGHGIGATCGILWSRGDSRFAATVAARWLSGRAKRVVTSVLGRDMNAARQAVWSIAGTMTGIAYGRRVGRIRTAVDSSSGRHRCA